MQRTEVVNLLQSLRGAQPLIVLVYLMVRQAMGIEELMVMTGLNHKTIRDAVHALAGKDLLHKQVGAHGRQVWLFAGDTLFPIMSQNPKIWDSGALSSSSSSVTDQSFLSRFKEQEEEPASQILGLCLKACDAAGIREPKRSSLARLAHVTPELIAAHVGQGKLDHVALGTVIYRIEHDWPLPEIKQPEAEKATYRNMLVQDDEEHDEECNCMMCKIAHPEKFCSWRTRINIGSRYGSSLSGECGARVVPGHRYCEAHLKNESQEMETP